MRQEADRPWEGLEVSVSFPPFPIVQPFPVQVLRGWGEVQSQSVSCHPVPQPECMRVCMRVCTHTDPGLPRPRAAGKGPQVLCPQPCF